MPGDFSADHFYDDASGFLSYDYHSFHTIQMKKKFDTKFNYQKKVIQIVKKIIPI